MISILKDISIRPDNRSLLLSAAGFLLPGKSFTANRIYGIIN
jgi:hypothetical protein